MSGLTPGEWRYQYGTWGHTVRTSEQCHDITGKSGDGHVAYKLKSRADGLLLAASKDLLAELENTKTMLDDCVQHMPAVFHATLLAQVGRAEAAIAKAKGADR